MNRNSTPVNQNHRYPGARWWCFDFHTHTPVSSDTPWAKQGLDLTPEQWLQKFMAAGIDCVAVTDHNSGAWIDRLKEAYDRMQADQPEGFRELYLFPGVELSVNGGFHLLAIFDPSATTGDIDTFLGQVDYQGTKGDSDGVTRKSPVEVIEAVKAAGGLMIPAHVDHQQKGLLRLDNSADSGAARAVLDVNTLRQIFNCDHVYAMEVVDPSVPRPGIYNEYRLSWTEVVGSDCHSFQGQALPGSRYTWIKMAEPSLEGLRLALMDGERFSVRRSDDSEPFDPNALPENYLESVEIHEARYMGQGHPEALYFSPWFNALVGGRGTGKSTVVHALRLALRRENELKALEEGSEPRRTFERFIREARSRDDDGALTQRTHIALTFVRDGARYRIHWPQEGSGAVVEEAENDDWRESENQAVIPERFAVRLFSQGQIAALAGGSQQALLDLIDEAAGIDDEKKAFQEARQTYLSLYARARELAGRLQGRDALKVRLEDVQRKLKKFEEAHHADVLKAYQHCSRQEREIARQFDSVDTMVSRIRELSEDLTPEDVPDQLFDAETETDAEALAVLSRLHQAIESAAQALKGAAGDLANSANRERRDLPNTDWQQAVRKARTDYEKLVQELKDQGVGDPSEYGQLVQERQRLEKQWKELDSLEAQRRQVLEQAQTQHQTVLEARRVISERREAFLDETLAGNEYVQIRLNPYRQDGHALEQDIREFLGAEHPKFENDILVEKDGRPTGGVVAELLKPLPADSVQASRQMEQRVADIKQRLAAGCQGQGDFGGHFNNFLERQTGNHPEFMDHLMIWFPDDGLEVKYSRKGDGRDFKAIEQASAGQRAAAMLAFLLAHGSDPIVLDQPEDDLDNHLIYNLVVRQLRENKLRRQIITVTHNPNIVVNGDAEMLHALDFSGGQCRVTVKGSLQDKAMRDEVCHVMEGGRDAFDRRYRRLGQEV
ncbi:MAG: hypothetical protein U5L07_13070 [Desulfobacterales bacterium]|nr:hypothetical protein [Desulfobacterales bacterium]